MKSTFYANIELGGEITQVSFKATSASAVSYTHLTLPTKA